MSSGNAVKDGKDGVKELQLRVPLRIKSNRAKCTKTAQAKREAPERMVLKALIKSLPCRLHVSVMVSKEQ